MKYLLQFCRILLISFVSEILHTLIPLPIPASIYGIVIMFLLLETGLMKVSSVRETGKFLIEIMPVMFIPAAVGLIDSWGLIAPSLAAYIFVTCVSTLAVMAAAGLMAQAVIRRKKAAAEKKRGV